MRSDSSPASTLFVPSDYVAIVVYVLLAQIIWILPEGSFARLAIALPLLFVLPGFVLTTVLYPTKPDIDDDEPGPTYSTIDGIERWGLAFGLSIAILPVLALIGHGLGFALSSAIIPLTIGWVLLIGAIGWIRRLTVPHDRRYVVHLEYAGWTPVRSGSVMDTSLGVILVASVLLASGALMYGVAQPPQGETYTQFMVGSMEGDQFVVGSYATELSAGSPSTFTVLLENNEQTDVEYHVVVQLEDVEDGELRDRQTIARQSIPTEHGQRLALDIDVVPETTEGDARITFLLFKDEVPDRPGRENADDVLHIWVHVNG